MVDLFHIPEAIIKEKCGGQNFLGRALKQCCNEPDRELSGLGSRNDDAENTLVMNPTVYDYGTKILRKVEEEENELENLKSF